MHDERSRPELPPIRRAAIIEGAVLALLIEQHPAELTLPELVDEMCDGSADPGRRAAIEGAVGELTEIGLLHRRGAFVLPAPVALRVAELELGL